jgi:dGTPase
VRQRAPYASDPASSRGRRHLETLGETRGPRTAFQRDRDRIIHSIAFRRLKHKTQVFVAPDGDHFRVRLTHSLEVAQIGRTIARALGLDEDLTEALCLAHDIGHPPFGHAGEEALQEALADVGGFDHNGHTLRVLCRLESPYPRWDGLNLSWETLEGLAKHNGPVEQPGWAMAEIDQDYPLTLGTHAALEAQVAALADDIAYDNHDIDDGLRAGLLDFDQLLEVELLQAGWRDVQRRFPDVEHRRLRPELIRQQIGQMVNDVIVQTRAGLSALSLASPDEVRVAGRQIAAFSAAMAEREATLKTFMYANLYHHPRQLEIAGHARQIVRGLFDVFADDPGLLPEYWQAGLPQSDPGRRRHVADFVAGMTDRYAISCYRQWVGPVEMPDKF